MEAGLGWGLRKSDEEEEEDEEVEENEENRRRRSGEILRTTMFLERPLEVIVAL